MAAKIKLDTLVMIIADQNGGKSNQIRSVFEEFELAHFYDGYPSSNNIARKYYIHPDIDLFVRLSSWHEKDETYSDVKSDLNSGFGNPANRYKAIVAAQMTPTAKLVGAEELFIRLFSDLDIRRGFAVWLSPDRQGRKTFTLNAAFANFISANRNVSALAIDALAKHPSALPKSNCVNARLLGDMLFRM